MEKKDFFTKYLELINKIEAVGQALSIQHKEHMLCRKGCDSCCENISVFPLELDAINYFIGDNKINLPEERLFNRYRKSCNFLMNSACTIYEYRPIICRTQGYPLLYQNNNGDGYELSVCHLNFVGHKPSQFDNTNALYMPSFNSQLFLLNQEYVSEHYSSKFNSKSRVPLYKLYNTV